MNKGSLSSRGWEPEKETDSTRHFQESGSYAPPAPTPPGSLGEVTWLGLDNLDNLMTPERKPRIFLVIKSKRFFFLAIPLRPRNKKRWAQVPGKTRTRSDF